MKKTLLFPAMAAIAFLLQNCSRAPTEKAETQDLDPSAAQAKSDSESWAILLPAYELNRDASSRARLSALQSAAEQPVIVMAALPVFGTPAVGGASRLQAKPRPILAGAMLKSGSRGQGGAGAALPDSTFYVLSDSGLGRIFKVRVYTLVEAGANVEAADTLDYKWPYDSTSATVVGHHGSRAYAGGAVLNYAILDDDGDGILNAASAPKVVRLQKRWATVRGDTTWKSAYFTRHGSTDYYDSIGKGSLSSWTDSVIVSGKLVHTQRIFDGDAVKDDLLDSAKAGAKPRISRDSYTDNGDGTFLLTYEMFGAGADGSYASESDNERYAYRSMLVGPKGTVAVTRHGDGDGDGFYWNPAAAVNKAWIANAFTPSDSVPEYRDSLEQMLSGAGGSLARITHFSSQKRFQDGRVIFASAHLPSGAGFTGKDTIQVRERLILADYDAKGLSDPLTGLDSTLKVTWVVPGDPASPSDDRIIRLYSQVWHKPGQASVTASQLFTPTAPIEAGDAPTGGTLVIETRSNPTSSKSRIRSTLVREFDAAQDASVWTRTDHFENGDSAKSSGEGALAGAGTYTENLGRYARHSGYHDSRTGAFKDTLILLDFKGGEKSREIAWGSVDAEKGTGDYQVKRLGGRDTATAHIVVTAEGSGFLLTRETADRIIETDFHGDTASTSRTFAGVRHTYAWTAAGGAYTVTQKDENTVSGATVATGSYGFGQDLSGGGAYTRTPAGKSPVEAKVQFQSDGTVYVDGIRVEPW